jgi:hypothetical protein
VVAKSSFAALGAGGRSEKATRRHAAGAVQFSQNAFARSVFVLLSAMPRMPQTTRGGGVLHNTNALIVAVYFKRKRGLGMLENIAPAAARLRLVGLKRQLPSGHSRLRQNSLDGFLRGAMITGPGKSRACPAE